MMSAVFIRSTANLLCCRTPRPCQRIVLIWQNLGRSITTSGAVNQKVQMTRMLEKMIKKGGKKKWSGAHTSVFANADDSDRRHTYKVTEGNRRRAEQVGKVLFDYIVSLVNSGELHPGLVENSVEIATVKMAVDFSGINVYWYASGTDSDANTQALLNMNAGRLREMLISLRVIGNVPKISFVQDFTQAKVAELDRLLKIADMGPSEEDTNEQDFNHMNYSEVQITKKVDKYSPSKLSEDFNKRADTFDTLPSSMTSLQHSSNMEGIKDDQSNCAVLPESYSPREDNSLENLSKEDGLISADDGSHQDIPFRHDVYSLNREELVNKVIALKNRSKNRSLDQNLKPENESLEFPSISTLKSDGKNRKFSPVKEQKLQKYSMADYLTDMQESAGKFPLLENEENNDYIDDDDVVIESDSEETKT